MRSWSKGWVCALVGATALAFAAAPAVSVPSESLIVTEWRRGEWLMTETELCEGGSSAIDPAPGPDSRPVWTHTNTVDSGPAECLSYHGAFWVNDAFKYRPSVLGALGAVEFAIDSRQAVPGQLQGHVFVCEQDERWYFCNKGSWTTPASWQTNRVIATEADFVDLLTGNPAVRPDFGATGSPIRFGFSGGNTASASGQGYSTSVEFDNFVVRPYPSDCCKVVTGWASSEWSHVNIAAHHGGTSSTTEHPVGSTDGGWAHTVQVSGADPGFYSSIGGAWIHTGFAWNPSLQGPISSIDFGLDAARLQSAELQGHTFVLRQGQKWYIAYNYGFLTPSTPGNFRTNLTESDFGRLDGIPSSFVEGGAYPNTVNEAEHPDFSASGETIQFGFLGANSTGVGGSSYQTTVYLDNFMVCVTPLANRPPTAVPDDYRVVEDSGPNILTPIGNDYDDDENPIELVGVSSGARGAAVLSGQQVLYTPYANESGLDNLSYTIRDSRGATAVGSIRICIREVNDAPEIEDDTPETVKNQAMDVDVLSNDSDVDGDPLTVISLTAPTLGSVSLNLDGTVHYAPPPGYVGMDTFRYTAVDGRGGSGEGVVTVWVRSKKGNRPPKVRNDQATTTVSTPVLVPVLGNDTDPDGDSLVVVGVTDVEHGAVTLSAGGITFSPAPGFRGNTRFRYQVSDGHGGLGRAWVQIRVR